MVDFTKYQQPGLYAESVQGPQVSVQTTTPTAVGVFGLAVGFREQIESLVVVPDVLDEGTSQLEPAPNRTLRESGIRPDTIVVRNPNSGAEYALNTDYTVVKVSGGASGASVRDDLYTIERVKTGQIHEGDTVEVSYRFTDPAYFDPHIFYDYDDVRDAYGAPFDAAGNIQSELSLAANIAFNNGAYTLTTVAVDVGEITDSSQPPPVATLADYQEALDKLKDQPDVSVVVPATGIAAIQSAVQSHVAQQSNNRFERRAILGRDGAGVAVTGANLITDAQALSDERVALVSPASMKYFASELNREILIGGQFLAAAVAGVSVGQLPSIPLTRKQVSGFVDVGVTEQQGSLNLQSQNGVMVVERTRQGALRVRHGVTTNASNTLKREWNVTGQQDAMVYRLRAYLDNENLIGGIIDDLTLTNIKASTDASLQSLMSDRIIRNYTDLKVRQLGTQPDVVEVRYAWQPSLPLNYIVVRYSISVTTGESTVLQSL